MPHAPHRPKEPHTRGHRPPRTPDPSQAAAGLEAFGRAYAAALFLLGLRGAELEAAASGIAPDPVLRALSSGERDARIAVLARETAQITLALEAVSVERTVVPWG